MKFDKFEKLYNEIKNKITKTDGTIDNEFDISLTTSYLTKEELSFGNH